MLLPVAMAGMLMLPGGVVNCIVSVIAGGLYDRIGARIPARAGFALSIAGTVISTSPPSRRTSERLLRSSHFTVTVCFTYVLMMRPPFRRKA